MSSDLAENPLPPLPVGALLRFAIHDVRARIYEGVVTAGFDDLRPVHVTLFRWPGPDGRRPTEVAADAQISKQAVNDRLRDLERLGYLELEPDPTDARARIIRLTERGRRLHATAVAIHTQLEHEWAQRVGRRRFQQLRDTLAEITAPPDHRPQTTTHPPPFGLSSSAPSGAAEREALVD